MQVKGGSVFDNILICDDPDYAKQVVEEVFANREVLPFSLAFSVIIDQLNSSSLFEYLFLFFSFFLLSWEIRLKKKHLRKQSKWEKRERKRFLSLQTADAISKNFSILVEFLFKWLEALNISCAGSSKSKRRRWKEEKREGSWSSLPR
jgi:flagellar biosynthesis component FlhA